MKEHYAAILARDENMSNNSPYVPYSAHSSHNGNLSLSTVAALLLFGEG
jgi:hypothetical protein